MQSFAFSLYLYIVKAMRHLLLLAFLCCLPLHAATYAVIVSGGRSKLFNHERYWNDCAFLYRTLRQDYGIPKDHITLLMADGDNPTTDMLRDGATGFASSPTDLDGDGQLDLTLAATRQNLDDTFCRLSTTLTGDDHLFLFITDHGERTFPSSGEEGCPQGGVVANDVHLWLWGNDRLQPDELAAMVNLCHPATMSILLGQCHAGAFVAPLQAEGRVITTACSADQMSWACKDRPYDEFVYHWTCAIAQHDEAGLPVVSDQDGDGLISMQEAYDYARQHDRRPETPSLIAQPDYLAARWSFSGIGTKDGIVNNYCRVTANSRYYDLQGRLIKK